MAEAYADHYIAQAVEVQFRDLVHDLNEPDKRLIAFFEAISKGMPPTEAAGFFLELEAEEYKRLIDDNVTLRRLIQRVVANIAVMQYEKVIRADGYQAAIRWLEQNRAEDWQPKKQVDVTSKGEQVSGVVIVQIPDNGRDS